MTPYGVELSDGGGAEAERTAVVRTIVSNTQPQATSQFTHTVVVERRVVASCGEQTKGKTRNNFLSNGREEVQTSAAQHRETARQPSARIKRTCVGSPLLSATQEEEAARHVMEIVRKVFGGKQRQLVVVDSVLAKERLHTNNDKKLQMRLRYRS